MTPTHADVLPELRIVAIRRTIHDDVTGQLHGWEIEVDGAYYGSAVFPFNTAADREAYQEAVIALLPPELRRDGKGELMAAFLALAKWADDLSPLRRDWGRETLEKDPLIDADLRHQLHALADHWQFAPAVVDRQEVEHLRNQIAALRREVQELREQLGRYEAWEREALERAATKVAASLRTGVSHLGLATLANALPSTRPADREGHQR